MSAEKGDHECREVTMSAEKGGPEKGDHKCREGRRCVQRRVTMSAEKGDHGTMPLGTSGSGVDQTMASAVSLMMVMLGKGTPSGLLLMVVTLLALLWVEPPAL